LFTLSQMVGLAVLWIVKESPAALAFPFFVVAMIPYRLLVGCFYTPRELEAVSLIANFHSFGPFVRISYTKCNDNADNLLWIHCWFDVIFSWTDPRLDR
jgi:hypothetical protein